MEKIAKYIQPITKKSVYLVDFVEVPKEEGMDLEEESREERKPLEEEIEYYEYWVRYCIELYGDLSTSLKFYQDKMDTYYSNPTPSAPLREARELIEVCMLNLLISEMTYVKEAFDTIPNVAKKGLLPYFSEGLDISVGMNSLGTVYSFKNDFFPLEARAKEETDTLTATRRRTNEVASALQKSIVNYYCFKNPHDSKFNNLLERYKNEHVGELTLWEERRIGEFKEELIKLDDEFKEEPAVRCWFEAGGNILETLKKMYLKHLVMKDLLPLLKYMARYDLLKAREKDDEHDEGDGAPTENELKRRAIKDEIMAMMEWKDADDVYIFKKREHWEGVYYVLKADGHYTGFACDFKKFIIDKLGIDLKSLRVGLPAEKNQSRWLTYGNNISRDALKKQTEHTDIVDVGIRFAEELDTRLPQKDKKVPSE